MVDYQNGKIYKVVNNINNCIYIGSTCQPITRRMTEHRREAKTKTTPFYTAMRDVGIDHFRIILVKLFPCNSTAELEAEEYKVMKELQANGVVLYNDYIGGHSAQAKYKIGSGNRGKTGEQSISFNYGCINYEEGANRYCFRWYENGTRKKSSFSCDKYGEYNALMLTYQARKTVYPSWKTPEEDAINDLAMIEI